MSSNTSLNDDKEIIAQLHKFAKNSEITEVLHLAKHFQGYAKYKVLYSVAEKLIAMNKTQEVLELIEHVDGNTQSSIATDLRIRGKINEALSIAKNIQDIWVRNGALYWIGNDLVNLGKLEQALEVVEIIDYEQEKSRIRYSIVEILINTNDIAYALTIAKTIGIYYGYKVNALSLIAITLLKMEETTIAFETFQQAITAFNDKDRPKESKHTPNIERHIKDFLCTIIEIKGVEITMLTQFIEMVSSLGCYYKSESICLIAKKAKYKFEVLGFIFKSIRELKDDYYKFASLAPILREAEKKNCNAFLEAMQEIVDGFTQAVYKEEAEKLLTQVITNNEAK